MIDIRLECAPYHEMPFLNAAPGRRGTPVRELLPFFRATLSGLPVGGPTLVAMADLQGRTALGLTEETLLGWGVGDALPEIQAKAGLPDPGECLGLLAGDFYTVPNVEKRGGTGDVAGVWSRLEARFAHLAGVMGNHDIFDAHGGRRVKAAPKGVLDGQVRDVNGLRVGGVSGIIGDPARPNRRNQEDFGETLARVLKRQPHILLLHAAPQTDEGSTGDEWIAKWIRGAGFSGLVICGHVHWPAARVQHCGRATCVNVAGAVMTLTPVT